MNLRVLAQLVSARDLRNISIGAGVVIGGLGLAALTLLAHANNNARLAGIAAGLSLLFVLLILVFVIPPLARNASREASQLNLPFEITLGGAIMVILTLIVGFSAWNTGNNLLFIVLSAMLSAMLVGFFAGRSVLKKLDVKVRFPETIYAEQDVPVVISLTNRKRIIPAFSVVVEVRGRYSEFIPGADALKAALPGFIADRIAGAPFISKPLAHIVHVRRRSTEEVTVSRRFDERGIFKIKDFELLTSFPFGFFRHRRRLAAREAELTIFPAIASIDDELLIGRSTGSEIAAGVRGGGSDLLSLRDYVRNDDLRSVDWKATARSQRLTVKEFAGDVTVSTTVIFDTEMPAEAEIPLRELLSHDRVRDARFEQGVRLAATVLHKMAAEAAVFRVVVGDQATDYGSGSPHLFLCLSALAAAESRQSVEQSDLPERIRPLDDGKPIVLVTASELTDVLPEMHSKLKIIGF